jgi:biopolymer transport protein ExbD
MAGKFDHGDEGINDINITPFVDVVLVLLVIFMVTAPVMIQESLKVNLPKSLSSDGAGQGNTVGVAITKEGQVLLNGKLFSSEGLERELARVGQESPETHFLISADADARHRDLVRMIDLLKRYKLNRFALQVEKIKDQ